MKKKSKVFRLADYAVSTSAKISTSGTGGVFWVVAVVPRKRVSRLKGPSASDATP